MLERVKKILEEYNMSSSQLAETLGVQRSNISHILSGRNKPSLDLIQKMLMAFPDLSSDWVLFGKGEMKKAKEKPVIKEKEVAPESKKPSAPLPLPQEAPKPIQPKESSLEVQTGSKKDVRQAKTNVGTKSDSNKGPKTSKSIERIIVLNDDMTFKEYKPEE